MRTLIIGNEARRSNFALGRVAEGLAQRDWRTQFLIATHMADLGEPQSFLVRQGEEAVESAFEQATSNISYLQKKLRYSASDVKEAVKIDQSIMHGNPVFSGTRIPVYQVIEELAEGTSLEALVKGYPSLTVDKIRKALDFTASLLRIYND